jgi:acetyl esterase/lipase
MLFLAINQELLLGEFMNSKRVAVLFLSAVAIFSSTVRAQDGSELKKRAESASDGPRYDASVPVPTLAGIHYGEHERQVLDFWRAPSDTPTPLVFVIHGGSWIDGSKERLHRFTHTATLLKSGISVVAIDYRLMAHTQGIEPANYADNIGKLWELGGKLARSY